MSNAFHMIATTAGSSQGISAFLPPATPWGRRRVIPLWLWRGGRSRQVEELPGPHGEQPLEMQDPVTELAKHGTPLKNFYIRTWAVATLENGSQQCSGPCRKGMSISPVMVFNHSPFLTPTQLSHSDSGLWIHLSTAVLCEEVCSATDFRSRTGLFPAGLHTLVLPCPSSVPPNVSFGI